MLPVALHRQLRRTVARGPRVWNGLLHVGKGERTLYSR